MQNINTHIFANELQLEIIPALKDNYIYVLHNNIEAIVIDPGQSEPVINFLAKQNLKLVAILLTHGHYDHTDGVQLLLNAFSPEIYGRSYKLVTYNLDLVVTFTLLGLTINVIKTPGHTFDSICFYIPQHKLLFTGDTLFSAGCGRNFECSYKQLFNSLQLLAGLPNDTVIYVGHEYTLANLAFALNVEPENNHIKNHIAKVKLLLEDGLSSMPTNIALEKQINPFLRLNNEAVIRYVDLPPADANPLSVFSKLRLLKNTF